MARAKLYGEDQLGFFCPGCECDHAVRVSPDRLNAGPNWGWNGSLESPTITPSILVMGERRCHSFMREGKIQFLDDCHHALKGQTVNLPDWE